MPNADAGPLNGALWPIVISLSLTPGPYFLSWACAAAATTTSPTASTATFVARINSPCPCRPLDVPVPNQLKTVHPACKQKIYHLLGNAMADILILGISHYPP